jgi:uncharacterized protein (TIGR02996 family)
MTERSAFYQAIWTRPDDDLPRLVFADWLEEQNEPDAAQFLRLLCVARTCPPDIDRLRPLVADLRRTMVKLPAEFIEKACPVRPDIVVGPWVDIENEANRLALTWISKNRWARLRGTHSIDRYETTKLDMNPINAAIYGRITAGISAAVVGTAACLIDGIPAVVHVWSGVIVALSRTTDYVYRGSRPMPGLIVRPDFNVRYEFGSAWQSNDLTPEFDLEYLDEYLELENQLIRECCQEFEPS